MKSLGLLLLRLVVGGIFAIHGYPKLFGGKGKSEGLSETSKATLGQHFVDALEGGGIPATTGMMEHIGLPFPKGSAWAVTLAEFVGGLMLALGIKTRPVGLALAFSQLVAINKVHSKQGLVGGYEFNLTLAAAATAIAISGPGKIAVD